MLRSPIFAFFSPPASPTHAPAKQVRQTPITSPNEPNVALFTHQDGKKFEVTIMRLDDAVDLAPESGSFLPQPREEDWDSDDWDEDAEDWEESAPIDFRSSRATAEMTVDVPQVREAGVGLGEPTKERREFDDCQVDDWDGDAEDLEEPPVAVWTQGQERLDWAGRSRGADVWRTRLGEED